MAERYDEIRAHIQSVRQLSLVVSAMRNLAAARAREARDRLGGIEAYSGAISAAIADALGIADLRADDPPAAARGGAHVVLAICAEQGFAGAFSERVIDAAVRHSASGAEVMIVGNRGRLVAAERAIPVRWSTAMIGHVDQAASLADRLTDALFRNSVAASPALVDIVHAAPGQGQSFEIRVSRLIPFDYSRFPPRRALLPPLITLKPEILLGRLAEEYVFAELCAAIILSFASENEARLRAMTAAHSHVESMLDALEGRGRQVRQEEITSEILELVTGRMAGQARQP